MVPLNGEYGVIGDDRAEYEFGSGVCMCALLGARLE
jgi:hypothetical protein